MNMKRNIFDIDYFHGEYYRTRLEDDYEIWGEITEAEDFDTYIEAKIEMGELEDEIEEMRQIRLDALDAMIKNPLILKATTPDGTVSHVFAASIRQIADNTAILRSCTDIGIYEIDKIFEETEGTLHMSMRDNKGKTADVEVKEMTRDVAATICNPDAHKNMRSVWDDEYVSRDIHVLDDPKFKDSLDAAGDYGWGINFDTPQWVECETFTDCGFGFRCDTGDHIDYMIAWPVEPADGSWALLSGADTPQWVECETFTDCGFGFRCDTGDHIDYMIAWPVEPADGSWALLSGAYSIDDEDRDDYCDAEFLGQVLHANGFSSLEELQDVERSDWVNALTCMVAEKQADTRFEVPNIVRSDEALGDAFSAAGVPREKLGALMDFARNDALTDAGGVGALEEAARVRSDEALGDAFSAAGVPREKLGALMDFARNDALTDAGGVGALEEAARAGSEGIDTGVCETGTKEL